MQLTTTQMCMQTEASELLLFSDIPLSLRKELLLQVRALLASCAVSSFHAVSLRWSSARCHCSFSMAGGGAKLSQVHACCPPSTLSPTAMSAVPCLHATHSTLSTLLHGLRCMLGRSCCMPTVLPLLA